MQEEWQVARGAPQCTTCGTEFEDGRVFYSALTQEGSEFVRLDYCTGCWERGERPPHFSFWRTRRQTRERSVRIDSNVVFDLFRNLVQGQDAGMPGAGDAEAASGRAEMRFVLALYLTRRKALKLEGVSREGDREVLHFRRPRSDEQYTVEDPHLSEDRIEAATQKLKSLFQGEL